MKKKLKNKKLWLLSLTPISFIPFFAISASSRIIETKYFEFPSEWRKETTENTSFSPALNYSHLKIFEEIDKYKWKKSNTYREEVEGSHGSEFTYFYYYSNASVNLFHIKTYNDLIEVLKDKIDFVNTEQLILENEIKEQLKKQNIDLNSIESINLNLEASKATYDDEGPWRNRDIFYDLNLTDLNITFFLQKNNCGFPEKIWKLLV